LSQPGNKRERGYAQARKRMVEEQLVTRGVRDVQVLEAMRWVPRELFVPARMRAAAYADSALPIAAKQTISQPYIVARMIEALGLQAKDRVLEIGAGSGYAAAVVAEIADQVYAIERIEELAEQAAGRLAEAGYTNITVLHADGSSGLAEFAPFDAILVSAGAPEVLKGQLTVGGRLVVPVGSRSSTQALLRVTRRSDDEFLREDLAHVRFVPLIGEKGWAPGS